MNRNLKLAALASALFLGVAGAGVAIGADMDKDKEAQKMKNVEAGYWETKDLLRLMDKDKNGKVSKKEFMEYMEAEFDRLDTDHNGELDVSELSQMKVSKHTGGSGSR
ncbi:MAG TPA: EF-hand domain-containing protein [Burkholderiaceae bacterium]|nr:EF-hand domain-containing protein [Burkholderiaceae bacterium]